MAHLIGSKEERPVLPRGAVWLSSRRCWDVKPRLFFQALGRLLFELGVFALGLGRGFDRPDDAAAYRQRRMSYFELLIHFVQAFGVPFPKLYTLGGELMYRRDDGIYSEPFTEYTFRPTGPDDELVFAR
jgi:hypothetical protein